MSWLAVGPAGELFICDAGNSVVREVTPAVTVTISASTALPTLTALEASATAANTGQSITFTATVSDKPPGGATPNGGTVTFSDQYGVLDSETLFNGVATYSTSSLPVGTDTITASYSGTTAFGPSSDSVVRPSESPRPSSSARTSLTFSINEGGDGGDKAMLAIL